MGTRRRAARAGHPASSFFDAATEEPALLEADSRARAERPHRHGSTRARRGRHRVPPADPGLMVDPRIAVRRCEVEAGTAVAASRRRRRWGTAIGAVLVVAAGALTVLSPLVGVSTVGVSGAPHTGAAAVRVASGLRKGQPLVRIDSARATARVRRLPWVSRVTLERRWPRSVVLTVTERVPAAIVACQDGGPDGCLVDRSGRVLASTADDPEAGAALPHLTGVPVAGGPGSELAEPALGPLAVATALPNGMRDLVAGVRGDGGGVSLDLRAPGRDASPPVVRLGPPDRIPEKLTAAATVLARTSVNGVAVLDVRVPESPALTRIRR